MFYNYICDKCHDIYAMDEDRMTTTREAAFVSEDNKRVYALDVMHAFCPKCGVEMRLVEENDTETNAINEKE